MIKKHSEHKGPAPPPPSSVKSISNEEPQNVPLVLKIEDNQDKETELEVKCEELKIPKSEGNEHSEISDSIKNNSELENQPIDIDDNNSVSIQSIQLRQNNVLNPRPMSISANINGPAVNSMDDSQIKTKRRSSSASNRNQRRPSPPSLDKVLQMNQSLENKSKIPLAVMSELAGRLQSNQDETESIQNKDSGK